VLETSTANAHHWLGGSTGTLVVTGNLSFDLELTVALCLIVGFGIAWAIVGWCRLDEHKY